MERGDSFPMVVVRKAGKSNYVIVGGNHRCAAAELKGITSIEAYVISTNDGYVIDILPRVLNRRGGRRTSKDEAFTHALYAIQKYNVTAKAAAEAFGVSEKAIYTKLTINEARERLISLGIPAQSSTDRLLQQLSVVSNDNVMASAANLAIRAKLNGDESAAFIKAVRQGRTEASQMAVVADYEERLGVGKTRVAPPKVNKQKRGKFLRVLTSLEGVLARITTLNGLQITTTEEREDVSRRLLELASKCRQIAGSGGTGSSANGHQGRTRRLASAVS